MSDFQSLLESPGSYVVLVTEVPWSGWTRFVDSPVVTRETVKRVRSGTEEERRTETV